MERRGLCQVMREKMFKVKALPTYEDFQKTELARVLGIVDLLSLGIGTTIGLGVYVVGGQVARLDAGPSVMLSFLVAGIASLLAGVCYAEFASRVPRAGSAYVYSYVTLGEFLAFIIGWTLVLEHAIGSAAVSRAGSAYIDYMLNKSMSTMLEYYLPLNTPYLAEYPDFLAFFTNVGLSVLIAIGVKESGRFNLVLLLVNLSVVLFTIIVFLVKGDINNWFIKPDEIPAEANGGDGGYFPFGFEGTMAGAAVCFYTYVGFDTVATAGEESKNANKNVPISIIVTIVAVTVIYVTVTAAATIAAPYYTLDLVAYIPFIFEMFGWKVVQYFIFIAALCGLITSLVGVLFPLPRILYAMGSDNVIFPCFAWVNDRFKTPLTSTLVSGIFTGIIAMLFNVKELFALLSIGTLMSYALVSGCVVLLRYKEENELHKDDNEPFRIYFILIKPCTTIPTKNTVRVVRACLTITVLMSVFITVLIRLYGRLMLTKWWSVLLLILLLTTVISSNVCISRQPQHSITLDQFQVPLLPWVSTLSIFVNMYLMAMLSTATWIRFFVWMVIGFVIYFIYGIYTSYQIIKNTNSLNTDKEDTLLVPKNPSK